MEVHNYHCFRHGNEYELSTKYDLVSSEFSLKINKEEVEHFLVIGEGCVHTRETLKDMERMFRLLLEVKKHVQANVSSYV